MVLSVFLMELWWGDVNKISSIQAISAHFCSTDALLFTAIVYWNEKMHRMDLFKDKRLILFIRT